MGHNHPALVELVKVCLSNVSVQRPTADDLVVRLRRMKEKMNEQFNGGDIIKQLQIKRLKQRKVCRSNNITTDTLGFFLFFVESGGGANTRAQR